MLISPREVLAQDLRRQDLLSQAHHDGVARDQAAVAGRLPTTAAVLRQAVGTVLIRAGERLPSPSTAPVATGSPATEAPSPL